MMLMSAFDPKRTFNTSCSNVCSAPISAVPGVYRLSCYELRQRRGGCATSCVMLESAVCGGCRRCANLPGPRAWRDLLLP
jgi:hypothetical protein